MNNKQLTLEGMRVLGWNPSTRTSTKYKIFETVFGNRTLFVGRSGALRTCSTGQPISLAYSLTNGTLHKFLIAVGRHTQQVKKDSDKIECAHVMAIQQGIDLERIYNNVALFQRTTT